MPPKHQIELARVYIPDENILFDILSRGGEVLSIRAHREEWRPTSAFPILAENIENLFFALKFPALDMVFIVDGVDSLAVRAKDHPLGALKGETAPFSAYFHVQNLQCL